MIVKNNKITITKQHISHEEVPIASPGGFHWAVIVRGRKAVYDEFSYLPKIPITMDEPESVIAVFTHEEYARIFANAFVNGKDIYVQKLDEVE